MATITQRCPRCQKYFQSTLTPSTDIICPNCYEKCGRVEAVESVLETCPICQCKQFWVQKDFNQFLGCAVMLVGIILVPWTYGLSLPIFALLDWLIYQRLAFMAVCYRCASELRGLPVPKHLKPFMHHIGLKYDKYR